MGGEGDRGRGHGCEAVALASGSPSAPSRFSPGIFPWVAAIPLEKKMPHTQYM
jgi:hypothetical protein